ncbi:nitrite reductase/ring-hydroxylating ferredoxin subunit [Georgenia soli]|uniref:Cytochrome bc1 complex Rieske iron-sulfur subunit n=1 Tax=Georgenia soli TaxID=638953 RepID=A0A2A9EMT1_9MICO|nr:Rieske (2Fe-2S) protein [Georgenia soli]PFG40274.1 nitrite reductase/ring-hydroxylating ferredoxin subunit [Georgenia soli]
MDLTPSNGPARRSVLLAGTGLLSVPLLAACGGGGGTSDSRATPPPSAAGTRLMSLADVPVGSGVVLEVKGASVVVVQPEQGTAKAFSGVCTHQGCVVQIGQQDITCPCHGSEFSFADGSVVRGPAERPLPPVPVTVVDGDVVLA